MKRSEVNRVLASAKAFLEERRFALPPFGLWSPVDWRAKGPEAAEIVERELGWDVTDFGRGAFESFGLVLFTLRNGDPGRLGEPGAKIYAEKAMLVRQRTPMHYHWRKTEDIINRGGGAFVMQVYNATPGGGLADSPVHVHMDGVARTFAAGTEVVLRPGESMTVPAGLYHAFWSADPARPVLVGEVSVVNDDHADNRFLEPIGRFPRIEEDEEPVHLLVGDYGRYWTGPHAYADSSSAGSGP